jgi:hypothetical protein
MRTPESVLSGFLAASNQGLPPGGWSPRRVFTGLAQRMRCFPSLPAKLGHFLPPNPFCAIGGSSGEMYLVTQLRTNAVKPRHAAALVLIGWYLMAPPLDRHRRLLTNKPLTRWSRVRTFDSEHACKEWLASLLKSFKGQSFENFEQAVQADRVLHGRCIASDDPRLAKWGTPAFKLGHSRSD